MSGHSETVQAHLEAPSIQAELACQQWPSIARSAGPSTSEARLAGRDSYAVTAIADITDRSLHAAIARFTAGLSPAALADAYLDWATHLAYAPGKRLQLVDKAIRKAVRFANYARRCAPARRQVRVLHRAAAAGQALRRRRVAAAGRTISSIRPSCCNQQWWHNATTGVRGVSKRHEEIVEFASRQMLDMVSPSNFLLTNPEVLQHTAQQGRHESRERLAEPHGGLGARRQRQEAGRHRSISGRPRRRGDARARSSIAIA